MKEWINKGRKHAYSIFHSHAKQQTDSSMTDATDSSLVSNDNRGVLYKEEIRRYRLIDSQDLDGRSLQTCSYDLRLGNKHYLFDDMGNLMPIFLGNDGKELEKYSSKINSPSYNLCFPSGQTDILVIPRFGSAIIELMETVDTLYAAETCGCLVVGRFDLKLSAIYKGLISQQATQVEPCYRGKLYCFLHNLTAQEVKLKLGDRVATIEFLHAGASLSKSEVEKIVDETKNKNRKKYQGEFAYKGEGIKDVRWLCSRGSLPQECGLAPINRKVNDNIEKEIRSFMEKDATVDWYSERIGKRIDENQGVVKLVLSLIIAVLSLIGVSFVTDVLAQLRYFEEQLAFVGNSSAGSFDPKVLAAIEAHTQSFNMFRKSLLIFTIIAVALVAAILLVYYFFVSETYWIRKRNRLDERESFDKRKGALDKEKKDRKDQRKRDKKEERRKKAAER